MTENWTPIETAAKNEDVEILVHSADGYFVAVWDRIANCFCEASSGDPLDDARAGSWSAPTHWMPLPKPPTEGASGDGK